MRIETLTCSQPGEGLYLLSMAGGDGERYRHTMSSQDQTRLSVASLVASMGYHNKRWSQVTAQIK
jgi:hypothetical protein